MSLAIDRGQFKSITGHSGCGKSTLLNVIAGLTTVTRGTVLLESQEVKRPGPDCAVVFQNHSLLPWLSVRRGTWAARHVFNNSGSFP